MTDPVLVVTDLSVTYDGPPAVLAVRQVALLVRERELLGVVGESGSGKSSLCLALMGLLPGSAVVTGEARLDGTSLLGLDDAAASRLRGRDIAMVFQDSRQALTPVLSVGAQVAEALRLHDRSLSTRAARVRVDELLAVVGLGDVPRTSAAYPHELSGGMRQRVMIAMAIANRPRLIVADEPTSALDVTVQAQVLDVLQRARELTGAAVLLVTHDLGVVAGQADRVAVMYAGRVVEQAPTADLFARPRMPYTVGLLRSMPSVAATRDRRLVPMDGRPPVLDGPPVGCPFAARCPAVVAPCRAAEPPLAPVGDGRLVACLRADELEDGRLDPDRIFPRPPPLPVRADPSSAPAVLELVDVHRHFPVHPGSWSARRARAVRAVDGVSFTVRAGQTFALVGESGCGKTTTVMQVLELAGAQRGTISLAGQDTATLTRAARRALRRQVQVVFQDPGDSLDPRTTVGRTVAEPLAAQHVARAEQARAVARVLDLVGLDPTLADRYPHELSGGQRQRVAIARALVPGPALVVLDEPTSALDTSVQAGIVTLLQDLQESLGLAYLLVAHDLALVRQVADHVAVMYLGRVVESAAADDLFAAPRHPYTRALLSAVPVPDPPVEATRRRILLPGDPTVDRPAAGCRFAPRCPLYRLLPAGGRTTCDTDDPRPRAIGSSDVACHWAQDSGRLPG